MISKPLIWIGIFIFSTIGSSIPLLWHAGWLSLWSISGSLVGGLFGIWVGFKVSQYM